MRVLKYDGEANVFHRIDILVFWSLKKRNNNSQGKHYLKENGNIVVYRISDKNL